MQGHPEEFADFIFALHGDTYENYMEVGSAASGTTRMLNDFFDFEKIVIIDDNKQFKEYPYREINLMGLPYVEFIGNSQGDFAHEYVKSLNMEFDLVYIDGDHSYEGVRNDFNNYFEFVKSGGKIGFHDTRIFPGVKKFMKELKKDDRLEFIGEYYRKMGMAIFKKI